MDISKLRSSEHLTFNKPNNPPISFKGHEVENGKFKFFVPAKQSSAGQVNVVREDGSKDSAKLQYRNGYLVAEMDMKSPSERVAYNFTVDGKTQVDLTEQKKIGNEETRLYQYIKSLITSITCCLIVLMLLIAKRWIKPVISPGETTLTFMVAT